MTPSAETKLTLRGSPLDKGRDLPENERRGPCKHHGLLRDAAVPHQKAVGVDNERAHARRRRRGQDAPNGRPDDRHPRDAQEVSDFPCGERQDGEGHDLREEVEFALQVCTLLRHFPVGAVSHHGQGHPVEVVESVVEGVVAMVGGGFTVESQVPLT